MLALNENYQCWGWDGGLARIGPKGILPRIGCRSRFGVVLARWHRSCGLLRRPERHRHRRVSYRERTACGPLILKYMQKVLGGLMIMPAVSLQRAQHNEGLPVHVSGEAFERCCVFNAG